MRIGITGWATSGKDEVANVLVEKFGYVKVSWASALRRDMEVLNPIVDYDAPTQGNAGSGLIRYNDAIDQLGYVEAKARYPEVRRLLQMYGTDVHREIDVDYWVKRTLMSAPPSCLNHDDDGNSVFPDTRYPNEADQMGFVLGVRRPGVEAVNTHVSDAGLAFPYVSVWIENDGTLEDLAKKTVEAYQSVLTNGEPDSVRLVRDKAHG